MLDDSRRLQLAVRILSLIQEEDLPQRDAEDVLRRTLGMLRAWHETKQAGQPPTAGSENKENRA